MPVYYTDSTGNMWKVERDRWQWWESGLCNRGYRKNI